MDENTQPTVGMKREDQLHLIETDTTNLVKYWQLRNTQMRIDRDLVNLIKPKKTTANKAEWMTNEPKVFFDVSRALVSLYPPRFRLPIIINNTPEEKDRMNKAERLAIGVYRTLDMELAERGGVSWLWELAYWVLLGWWSVFVVVEKAQDGIRFRADLFDPMNVYPQWDDKGLRKCIRAYETDETTAEAMAVHFQSKGLDFEYQKPQKGSQAQVINYWLRTFSKQDKPKIWNAIALNGILAKPMTFQRGLTRIPIHCGSVGSPDRITPGWEERRGESILYANRDMIDYRNAMIRLYAEVLANNTYPNRIWQLQNPNVRPTEELKGHGQDIALKIGEKIDLLQHSTSPQEAALLFSWSGQKFQEGALPPTVYGNVPFELSGFAISQYMATLKYKLGPYLNAMQSTLSRIMTDFLYQYKHGNFGDITLSTQEPSSYRQGMTYIEEFTQKDVPERIFVEVSIPITSQFDKTQQILNARQALTPPQIYSRETIWEMDGDVQDFEVERERIKQDMVEQDPFIISMDIIEGLWNRYEVLVNEGKTMAAQALKKYIFLKEMEIGARQGIPQTPQSPGVPPFQAPPESRSSPDVANAIFGRGPSGVARRPQTPMEREQSQGRRGTLVSPTGETLI